MRGSGCCRSEGKGQQEWNDIRKFVVASAAARSLFREVFTRSFFPLAFFKSLKFFEDLVYKSESEKSLVEHCGALRNSPLGFAGRSTRSRIGAVNPVRYYQANVRELRPPRLCCFSMLVEILLGYFSSRLSNG